MRSSTMAALATLALVSGAKLLSIPALQFDDRSNGQIWDVDVMTSVRKRWVDELGSLCLPKFDPAVCGAEVRAALPRAAATVRSKFDRCIRDSWFKSSCTAPAQQALQEIPVPSIMATIEKAISDRQAAAHRNSQTAQRPSKVEPDAERLLAAKIMGTDDGHSYLLAAYERRILAAERECQARPGMADLTEALKQSTRLFDPVGTICHAVMRNKSFVINPYGRPIRIGFPLPPFPQIWRPGKCADQGQQAWRCMHQAAEAIASRTAYWGELDHEIKSALRSLREQQVVPGAAARPFRY